MVSTASAPRALLLHPDGPEAGLIAGCLERGGFATRRVDTAEDALDACASDPPDLVVLAAQHDVAPRLRLVGARRSVAILLVADASALEAGTVSIGASGADDFLVRPVRDSELLARSAALVRLKEARDELRDRVHNLKNPLSAILVNCQFLLRHSNMDDEVREVVGEITESACALGRKLSGGGQASAQASSTTEVTP
ncbi:MAG TPA: hypothetical protein VMZ28_18255 [Kofleriaceae bacterium]|nr:hypothetical protein [Kofleriaceae bacterium]